MRAHLEVLTGVLVDERTADHRVDVLLGGQGHRSGDGRTGPLRRIDDLRCRPVELLMVVCLQPDADLLLCHLASRAGHVPPLLLDLRYDTGSDGAAALANREAEPL